MKKLVTLLVGALLISGFSSQISAREAGCCPCPKKDKTPIEEVPLIEDSKWTKIQDVAQYGEADWSNVVGKAEGITLSDAKQIAQNDPNIDYFFYMKGWQMVLGTSKGSIRIFHQGDAVFFKGEPWWGEAVGYADGYVKKK